MKRAKLSDSNNLDLTKWKVEDLNDIKCLNYLHDWNFPIFQFYESSNQCVLSKMAYKIFEEVGLFKSFDIPVDLFINFFIDLEKGYLDLPCNYLYSNFIL